jgi:putative membrane-bound dehydrogenase-like protein
MKNQHTMHYRFPVKWLSILTLCILAACGAGDQTPRKLEILFLGHNSEHHDSEEYMPILAGALSKEGFNISYTADPADLNAENLAWYDALIIYANHDSIASAQEEALLDFVRGGKGFLPIHCASYCFRNSEEYVQLVGAQFKSHETGTFTAEFVDTSHAIMKGLEPFETWDETYVHHLHNPDRTVLMERVEGDHREPWTWTRTYGDGRIFYTAYGHDERTWKNPGFQQLVRNGILWAVGDERRAQWEKLSFPEHVYTAEANIPNYEKRDPPPKLQAPFTPEESMKFIQVPAGFELELFAAEPDVINPISMAWDERGRLWVIETVDYPNELKPEQKGDDRIKICEDTDGDGKADKFTVFADGLNIPTSLVFANGGIIISMAPHFLFLKDTDGDDRADVREVIMTGWGTSDTHAGPSNLRYGFDNHIWGTLGYSGFEGEVAGKTYKFRQGFYRFKPDASSFEYVTRTSNNTWGLGFSETFDVFGSTANNAHSWYMAIPDRYYDDVAGLEGRGSKKIAGYYNMHPITPNVRQVDVFGGFTAAAGHTLYTARAFPREYWNRVAFVCEPTGHLLAKGVLEKKGSEFTLKDDWNMLAGSDEWVSPVQAEVGPDGALWVLDWYNFIIQHNPTPSPERGGYQAERGEGNAHINPLRDRRHGRIYRVKYKKAPSYKPLKLDREDPESLLAGLQSDNLFWRLTAQRLLVERGAPDVVPDLYELVGNTATDALGLNGAAVHALWTLHGLGAFAGNNQDALQAAVGALKHPAAGVRKAAVQVLPRNWETLKYFREAGLLNDPDPHTQLEVLLALSEISADEETGVALYGLSKSPEIAGDLWRSQALYIAAAAHRDGFLQAQQADSAPLDSLQQAISLKFMENYGPSARPAEETEEETDSDVLQITLRTVKHEMIYDQTELKLPANTEVEIVFENVDFMQHNLLILASGALEKVGAAADALAQQPDGMEKQYIPDIPEVLHATKLVDPGEKVRLRFVTPEEPGVYPFVCTFPGHWRTMNGVIEVTGVVN